MTDGAEDPGAEAREAAVELLAHRARSESELRRRLRRKGFDAEAIGACIERLREEGLVDDAGFAEAFARDRVRLKSRSRWRIVAELRKRGVDADVADAAVERAFAELETSEAELAREAALKWLRGQTEALRRALASGEWSDVRERARRRLYGYLGRRGFSGDVLRRAMEAAEEAAQEAERRDGDDGG